MLEGWLVYHRDDLDKNRWFADSLAQQSGRYGLKIRLQTMEDAGWAGAAPAFAINRSRDWRLSLELERRGCHVFNSSEVTRIGNDKIASHALAARLGLPQVDSMACENRPERLAAQCLGYPVVLKNPYGHGGSEVFLARDVDELLALASKLPSVQVLLEKLCARPGADVRVYVLGGEILAAVKRESTVDFRANLSLGGSAEYYELSGGEGEMVRRVAGALWLDYAGVDFLLDEAGGFLFNELEDAVGARSLYRLGGCDVIGLFLKHIRNALDNVKTGAIAKDKPLI